MIWWPYRDQWALYGGTPIRWAHEVVIPMWVPLAFVAVPTIAAWRRQRRRPPGHCQCGYDLTGNVSGRCPECGEAAAVG